MRTQIFDKSKITRVGNWQIRKIEWLRQGFRSCNKTVNDYIFCKIGIFDLIKIFSEYLFEEAIVVLYFTFYSVLCVWPIICTINYQKRDSCWGMKLSFPQELIFYKGMQIMCNKSVPTTGKKPRKTMNLSDSVSLNGKELKPQYQRNSLLHKRKSSWRINWLDRLGWS